ncbi:MAG TPA: MFS transporter [Aestuariivirgaceae bacterium]|jgi:MFS family permease
MIPSALQRDRWFYAPTVIIVAGCIVAIISFGVRSSMGLFTYPISEFHQWDREIYGLAMALQNLVWGMAQPIAGAFADRYGPSRVVAAGALVYALGTGMMAFAHTPTLIYLAGGLLVGIGAATASFFIVMAAFGRLVPPEKRSWAFGIATAAGSMGQFIFAPLGQGFIAAFGWQTALLWLAAIALLMVVFAIPLNAPSARTAAAAKDDTTITLRSAVTGAFGHPSFILLVLGFFVCGFQLAFVTIHLPAYLVEHGISAWLAAFAIAIIGIFNVIGSYAAGVIGSKYKKRFSLATIYLLRSLFVTLFISLPVTPATTLIFTASMGLLWLSTVPLTMGLVTVMFGIRYMATLYGFVFLSHQVGSFFGVWLGGRFHDIYGTYDPVWWMGVALGLFAALVHWPIREERAPAFAT